MIRLRLGVLLALGTALTVGACSTDFPSTSTIPTVVTITEPEFTGTLNINGAVTYPFFLTTAGVINVTVMGIDPSRDNTTRIGLQLGTWNGTVCAVTVPVLSNEKAFISTVITGQASGAGSYCARVFDAGQGGMIEPVTFDVQITHP